jgi:Fe-S-cluster containining protein
MQPSDATGTRTVEVGLEGDGWQLKCRMTVPTGPTRQSELLPLVRALTDAVVNGAVQAVEQAGEKISCRAGCGACCRNLVAISEVEARRIRAVVDAMPEPRRTVIRQRFADARRRLEAAGLLPQLQQTEGCTEAEYLALSSVYPRQGIPCPFLEEESCSIYEERPLTCREYLVVSPPENCAQPPSAPVQRVRLPLRVFNAVARWQVPPSTHLMERWVPLVLAPEWAEAHPDEPQPQPGIELLRELLGHLAGKPDEDASFGEPASGRREPPVGERTGD